MIKTELNKILLIGLSILIFITAYAFIRYYLSQFKVNESEALYIFNKGLSFTSAALISLSYIISNLIKLKKLDFEKNKMISKYFGISGFLMASIHVLISLMLLSPERYPGLYQVNGIFNFNGEMTVLFGVMAFSLFLMPAITSINSVKAAMTLQSWKTYQQIGYGGLIVIIFHVFFVDAENLIDPARWPYFLLPITIISLILIVFALILKSINLLAELKSRFKIYKKN